MTRALALALALIALPVQAGERFYAVALACPAGSPGPACNRENATDVAEVTVSGPAHCPLVGEILATHLTLEAGAQHKVACERRVRP